MNRGKILVLMFLLCATLFGNLYFQLKGSEDFFGTADEFQVLSSYIKEDSFFSDNSRDILPDFSSKINTPTLKTWKESGINSTEINRTLDLMIAQTLADTFPLESLENLSSSEPAQNSLQIDVGNLSISLQDGAEDNPYSDFAETYTYDVFERTSLLPKDGSFSYNFSTNTGSGNFESKFKSYESLHDSDNVTFLMDLWNSSENNLPINPYSTPMNLSFDYNLIAEENLRTAPYHRLEVRLSFMEPSWKGGKSGSISVALLKHLFTPENYDDPVLRVETSSGVNGQGYSYSEIYYNRSAVTAGSGWHHFEANITDVLHRFLNTTTNITSHYSVLDFIEVWAVSSVGDFNYTLLLDNFKLDYWPSAASVPLDLFWNGSTTSLNNGTATLNNTGIISSVSVNSSIPELNPKLEGKTRISLTRSRNESISSTITFSNSSIGYFEANLTLPTLITTNDTYLVSSILPATWDNLTTFVNGSSFPAAIEGIISSDDFYYPLAQFSWAFIGREGKLNGTISNFITQLSLPAEIQFGEWFLINGTLLAPSEIEVKANVTFGSTGLEFETLPVIDGSFSLFIPSIDFGAYTKFELRVFWADQFQAGFWERSVIVNGVANPPPEVPEGEMVDISPVAIGPTQTNTTVDLFYRVEYPKNGSQWYSNFPHDLIDVVISAVELWRGNELINVVIDNQTFQWTIDSTNNDEDLLVVKAEGPILYVHREQSEGKTIVECRLHSSLSYENITMVLPLSSLEQTVENWTVLDYLNQDITSQVSIKYVNGTLFAYSLSISAHSILVLRFSGKIRPMSIISLNIPIDVECGDQVQISGAIVSIFPFEGFIGYEAANSSFFVSIQSTQIENDTYGFLANVSSPPWNVPYHNVRLVLEDVFGNVLESEVFEIRSIDNKAPSVTVEYDRTAKGLNISILAIDGPSESGIANVSVSVISGAMNLTAAVTPEEKLGWYSAVISDPSFEEANVTILVRDWAGNIAVVEDTISLSPAELDSDNGSGIDLNPALIGSVFLVTVLSGNRMVRLVRGRKVEL
ncbi:MAG: hypothetical protein ACXAB4_00105 [Candidatus Hodarchaeales archaeon]